MKLATCLSAISLVSVESADVIWHRRRKIPILRFFRSRRSSAHLVIRTAAIGPASSAKIVRPSVKVLGWAQ